MKDSDRLREARKISGFKSAAAFAKYYGLSEVTYRAHENGVRGIPKSAAKRYSKILNISLDWLISGEKNPPNDIIGKEGKLILDKSLLLQCYEVIERESKTTANRLSNKDILDLSIELYKIALDDMGHISIGAARHLIETKSIDFQ